MKCCETDVLNIDVSLALSSHLVYFMFVSRREKKAKQARIARLKKKQYVEDLVREVDDLKKRLKEVKVRRSREALEAVKKRHGAKILEPSTNAMVSTSSAGPLQSGVCNNCVLVAIVCVCPRRV